MNSEDSTHNDIIGLISDLPLNDKQELFLDPIFCVGFIKILDQTVVSFIFQLLTKTIDIETLKLTRFYKEKTKEALNALKILRSLCLIEKRVSGLYLNQIFKKSFLKGLCDLKHDNVFKKYDINLTAKINKDIISKNTEHNTKRNESVYDEILGLIVDKLETTKHPEIKRILFYTKIINDNLDVTNKGFDFLLKTRKEQLWILLIAIIGYLKSNQGIDKLKSISMIFEMSLKKINTPYIANFQNKNTQKFLFFLEKMGFIKILKNEDSEIIFIISELFINLFEEDKNIKDEFLIVETNFKLYAYTDSKYELNILSLFCKIGYKLPGLICGIINEESMSNAFEHSITAEQINHYLKNKSKFLPENVSEQVFIWEGKNNRIQAKEASMFKGFLNLSSFQTFLALAKEKRWMVEAFEDKRIIFIKNEFAKEFSDIILKS